MNKKQLIARVQRYMGPGATRNTASAAVEAVLASIQQAADTSTKLHIASFGTFEQDARERLTFRPAKGFVPERRKP
ncbi:MAG: HU family DNA-binding protein [Akkermansia sp.]|nr:HU family DNA-binding protein [Akkermansia sp.]